MKYPVCQLSGGNSASCAVIFCSARSYSFPYSGLFPCISLTGQLRRRFVHTGSHSRVWPPLFSIFSDTCREHSNLRCWKAALRGLVGWKDLFPEVFEHRHGEKLHDISPKLKFFSTKVPAKFARDWFHKRLIGALTFIQLRRFLQRGIIRNIVKLRMFCRLYSWHYIDEININRLLSAASP